MPVASQSRQSADCWKLLEEAQEIINIGAVLTGHPEEPVATYKSSGSNPISLARRADRHDHLRDDCRWLHLGRDVGGDQRAVAVRSGALLG
jgi:hypothetical protein